MHRKFVQAFHVPGTLAADVNIRWTVPSDCQLVHVSAVCSDANPFGINIGTSADTDGFLTKQSSGYSNTPAEFDRDDFAGALLTYAGDEYPRFSDGDIIVIEVDYNYNGGGSGAACDDATIVLTFQEG
jgi:hypothetical protein